MPYLRYGFGVGGLYTDLSLSSGYLAAVQVGSPGAVVEVTDQLMFLFRPAASLRWDMFDGALGFVAEAQYDIASHPLVIDVDSDGDNADTLDYGGLVDRQRLESFYDQRTARKHLPGIRILDDVGHGVAHSLGSAAVRDEGAIHV